MSEERLVLREVTPELYRAYLRFDQAVRARVDPVVNELVKIRVSQINCCAFCLDMHTREARAAGEQEQRLHLLAAWSESDLFSPREGAALRLAEAITLLAEGHVPDEIWREAERHFSDEELAGLVMAVVAINGWNRIAISSRTPVPTTHA